MDLDDALSAHSGRAAALGITPIGLRGFVEVPGAAFRLQVMQARKLPHGGYITLRPLLQYQRMHCYLAEGGRVGGAILDRGNGVRELVSLFNLGGPPGAGERMVEALIGAGANLIEGFRGRVTEMYARHGFVEIQSEPWDDRLAPDGWDVATGGRPDVVRMALRRR